MRLNCSHVVMNDDKKLIDQVRIDALIEEQGTIKTYNELDPTQNKIDIEQIGKFLGEFDSTYMNRNKVKGPDYLITDNFTGTFGLEMDDLVRARKDAEFISTHVCS